MFKRKSYEICIKFIPIFRLIHQNFLQLPNFFPAKALGL